MRITREREKSDEATPLSRQEAVDLYASRVVNVARAMGRVDVCGPIPPEWGPKEFLEEEEKIEQRFDLATTLVSRRELKSRHPDSFDHERAHQTRLNKRGFTTRLGNLRIADAEDQPVTVVTNYTDRLKGAAQEKGIAGVREVLKGVFTLESTERKETAEIDDIFHRIVSGLKLNR